MRVLFLSNFYPPCHLGGYCQWCQEVAVRFNELGHEVSVLTSRHKRETIGAAEPGVHRLLHLDSDVYFYDPVRFFIGKRRREQENVTFLRETVAGERPDVLFVWGMWNMTPAVPREAEMFGLPVVYYVSDHWPIAEDPHTVYWRRLLTRDGLRLPKRLLGLLSMWLLRRQGKPAALQFEHVICVSNAVMKNLLAAGVPLKNVCVVHGGTDGARFAGGGRDVRRQREDGSLAVLYAGSLVPDKGVATAIEAVSNLVRQSANAGVHLTLVGPAHPAYERHLRELAVGMESFIDFAGQVPPHEMPSLLPGFDVLVFPSECEDALPRIVQEAMLCGLVVVGTTTGGTKEMLVEGDTGLTFEPRDSVGLARQLRRLVERPDLRLSLAESGRRTVFEKFTLDQMVADIEAYLVAVRHGTRAKQAGQGHS